MDQDLKQKTQERITKAENILICTSKDNLFDETASALALYMSLAKLGKKIQVIAKTPTVDDALKLYAVDKIGKNSTASSNLVVVVDDAINSVDKVTYFLDKDRLKIVIHPLSGANVQKNQISFENAPLKPDIIFTIGIKSAEELKSNIVHEQNVDSNVWIISVIKGFVNQKYAQVNISSSETSSISEIIAQLIQELALPINEDIAFNLYMGISNATSNFLPTRSTPSTFQIAAWLLKFGAGKASLAKQKDITRNAQPENFPSFPPASLSKKMQLQPTPTVFEETPIEQVEREKQSEDEWLKPPKIFKGAKSFDTEY